MAASDYIHQKQDWFTGPKLMFKFCYGICHKTRGLAKRNCFEWSAGINLGHWFTRITNPL